MNTAAAKQEQEHQVRRVEEVVVQPAVDIYERETDYVIVADVPGADQKGLELTLEERTLTLEAIAHGAVVPSGELIWGELGGDVRYRRTFDLSEDIQIESISAAVKNGVLQITLPKMAQRLPRKITVSAG